MVSVIERESHAFHHILTLSTLIIQSRQFFFVLVRDSLWCKSEGYPSKICACTHLGKIFEVKIMKASHRAVPPPPPPPPPPRFYPALFGTCATLSGWQRTALTPNKSIQCMAALIEHLFMYFVLLSNCIIKLVNQEYSVRQSLSNRAFSWNTVLLINVLMKYCKKICTCSLLILPHYAFLCKYFDQHVDSL